MCCSLWGRKESDTTEWLNYPPRSHHRSHSWKLAHLPSHCLFEIPAVCLAVWIWCYFAQMFAFYLLLEWLFSSLLPVTTMFKTENREASKWTPEIPASVSNHVNILVWVPSLCPVCVDMCCFSQTGITPSPDLCNLLFHSTTLRASHHEGCSWKRSREPPGQRGVLLGTSGEREWPRAPVPQTGTAHALGG